MGDSMREIVFDTETTGLDSRLDRIIELGCIELVNRFPTGRTFHHYIHPQDRAIDPEAQQVHGIGLADLEGKPCFHEIAEEFLAFIDGAALVAHNANFDIGFINAEFRRCGHPAVGLERVVDTLAIARRKHPMGPNSLDALCRRYGIDLGRRAKHGALLDSELLAEVYIELAGGRQAAFLLGVEAQAQGSHAGEGDVEIAIAPRPVPLSARLTAEEIAAHEALVARMGEKSLWLRLAAN